MILISDRPCNGVDLSHWNADPAGLFEQEWVKFFGHKATHFGGKGMTNNVDPKFHTRRKLAQRLDIRWRAFYTWVVPPTVANPAKQVELLVRTIGELDPGESVYLDWEDAAVTRPMIEEIAVYMDLEFPRRWFVYANDSTPDMLSWLEDAPVPIMHPNYSVENGLKEARRFSSMIWQCGEGIPPGFNSVVPLDYVLNPIQLNRTCGR